MPHLRIYGIPLNATQKDLEELSAELVRTLVDMPSLGVKAESIFIFFPADRREAGVGETIICDAVLFDTPERTQVVRQEFVDRVTDAIQKIFPKSTAKCLAFKFDRTLGCSTREPKKAEGK